MRIEKKVVGQGLLIFILALVPMVLLNVSQAGNMEPPGAPGSTMKSLDSIQPVWVERLRADDGEPCSSSRFRCSMDDEVVLDMETGLAWERTVGTTARMWSEAKTYCYSRVVGKRRGFRLPTAEELGSLLECPSGSTSCRMPLGNPFEVPSGSRLWSATTYQDDTTAAWVLDVALGDLSYDYKEADRVCICVRGRQGYDSH